LFHEIPKARVELFRFLEPAETKLTSGLPFVNTEQEIEVLVREYPSKKSWAVLFLNRKNEKTAKNYSIKDLIGETSATCFAWDISKSEELGIRESLAIELPAHHSKLIFISTEGKSPNGINLNGK
jgi:hypothetical protein